MRRRGPDNPGWFIANRLLSSHDPRAPGRSTGAANRWQATPATKTARSRLETSEPRPSNTHTDIEVEK